MKEENQNLKNYFNEHIVAARHFTENNNLDLVVKEIVTSLLTGGIVYAFGNGGSAAEASHFVAELLGRFEKERKGYRAVCLNSDISIITALSNDYGYEQVFSKQLEGLLKNTCEGTDLVIGFSTSGKSKNVCNGFASAKKLGVNTIGFCGAEPFVLNPVENNTMTLSSVHTDVKVPSMRTCIVQEIHLMAIHYIAGEVEKAIL